MKTFPNLEDLVGNSIEATRDLLDTMNYIKRQHPSTSRANKIASACLERIQKNVE